MAFQTPLTPSTPQLTPPNLTDLLTDRAGFEERAIRAPRQPRTDFLKGLATRVGEIKPITQLLGFPRTRPQREAEFALTQDKDIADIGKVQAETEMFGAQRGLYETQTRDLVGQIEGMEAATQSIRQNPDTWNPADFTGLSKDDTDALRSLHASRVGDATNQVSALTSRLIRGNLTPEQFQNTWNDLKSPLLRAGIIPPEMLTRWNEKVAADPSILDTLPFKESLKQVRTVHNPRQEGYTLNGDSYDRYSNLVTKGARDLTFYGTGGVVYAMDPETGRLIASYGAPTASGNTQLSSTQIADMNDIDDGLSTLDTLEYELFGSIAGAPARLGASDVDEGLQVDQGLFDPNIGGFKKGFYSAGGASIMGKLFGHEGAKTFLKKAAILRLAKQVIGKGLEGGVLRKEDEEKYKFILPAEDDPKSVVQSKLRMLRLVLNAKRFTHLQNYSAAGKDVAGFLEQRTRVGLLPVLVVPNDWDPTKEGGIQPSTHFMTPQDAKELVENPPDHLMNFNFKVGTGMDQVGYMEGGIDTGMRDMQEMVIAQGIIRQMDAAARQISIEDGGTTYNEGWFPRRQAAAQQYYGQGPNPGMYTQEGILNPDEGGPTLDQRVNQARLNLPSYMNQTGGPMDVPVLGDIPVVSKFLLNNAAGFGEERSMKEYSPAYWANKDENDDLLRDVESLEDRLGIRGAGGG